MLYASHQGAGYARTSYAGAGEARVARVTFAVRIHSVCSIDYPSHNVPDVLSFPTSISIAKECHPHISLS